MVKLFLIATTVDATALMVNWETIDIALHTSDKQVAEKKLRDIVKQATLESDGLVAPKQQRYCSRTNINRTLKVSHH